MVAQKRLGELEKESETIIERYLQQVHVNPEAAELEQLRTRLASVRKEQTELYAAMAA